MGGGVWAGRYVDKFYGQGIQGKPVEDTTAVGIPIEAVVQVIDIELDRRGPPIHDAQC